MNLQRAITHLLAIKRMGQTEQGASRKDRPFYDEDNTSVNRLLRRLSVRQALSDETGGRVVGFRYTTVSRSC